MNKLLLTLLITIFTCNISFSQNKFKSLLNKVKKSDNTEQADASDEEFDLDEEQEQEKPDKKKKEKKQKENPEEEVIPTPAEPVDQTSYSWEEDQKLYYYLVNEKKDYQKAIQIGKIMLEKAENDPRKEAYRVGQSHSNLGMAYYHAKDYLTAHHHLLKASEISEEQYGGSSMALANDFVNISNNYLGLGFKNQAATYLKTALDIKISYLGGNSEQVVKLKQQYSDLMNGKTEVTPKTAPVEPAAKEPSKVYTKPTEVATKVVSRIDTVYFFTKDTVVIKKETVVKQEGTNTTATDIEIDDAYREEIIQEAINKFNEQQPKVTSSTTGISEQEKQNIINEIKNSINIPAGKTDTIVAETKTVSYELNATTKQEIIDAVFQKVQDNQPEIQQRDSIVVKQHLTEAEKEELANIVLTKINGSSVKTGTVKEKAESIAIFVTVKKGDSLYSLSRKYNTNVETLKRLNGLVNNSLKIGMKLRMR